MQAPQCEIVASKTTEQEQTEQRQDQADRSGKALIVDVPMPTLETLLARREAEEDALIRRAEELAEARRRRALAPGTQCTHLLASGRRCPRWAEPGMDECQWHHDWYSRLPRYMQMPYPEDGISLQHVLAQTAAMVLNREIEPEQASVVARLCREMRANLARFQWEMARMDAAEALNPIAVLKPGN